MLTRRLNIFRKIFNLFSFLWEFFNINFYIITYINQNSIILKYCVFGKYILKIISYRGVFFFKKEKLIFTFVYEQHRL